MLFCTQLWPHLMSKCAVPECYIVFKWNLQSTNYSWPHVLANACSICVIIILLLPSCHALQWQYVSSPMSPNKLLSDNNNIRWFSADKRFIEAWITKTLWMQNAEHCSAGGATEGTWICRGRLELMVYSSSLVGFSLHISTSSRSMSPLMSRPLATRPTRVTPHSTGMPSELRADRWQPESLTAVQTHIHNQRAGRISKCYYSISIFLNNKRKSSDFWSCLDTNEELLATLMLSSLHTSNDCFLTHIYLKKTSHTKQVMWRSIECV